MKIHFVLILLQALVVVAVPAGRRLSTSCVEVVKTKTTTITIEPATKTTTVEFDGPEAKTEAIASLVQSSKGAIFVEKSSRVTTPATTPTPDVAIIPTLSTITIGDESEVILTTLVTISGPVFFESVITSTVTPNVSVITVSTNSGTAQILPTLSTQTPNTEGTIITSLNATKQTSAPLISTSISSPSTIISPIATATSVISPVVPGMASGNIFQPVATGTPSSSIPSRGDHPVPRLGIKNQTAPIGTNKFYGNFYLGNQDAPTWTNPYSVAWSKGGGASGSWGMAISHVDPNQRVYGPDANANPVSYYINPSGIQSIVLSATELRGSTQLTMDSITAFAANVNLSPSPGAATAITFPLVQGMGFVTGIFNGGTPVLQSGVFFRSISRENTSPKPGVTKYRITLEDGKIWLMYAVSSDGTSLEFQVVNNGMAQATSNFNGFIQVAKNPDNAEDVYDAACGAYATDVVLSGSVNGSQGSYTMSFTKGGMKNATLMMFALPHHVQSLSNQTRAGLVDVQLQTTTKGIARGILSDSWTLVEALPTSMGFAPWRPEDGSQSTLSAAAKAVIKEIAESEVSQDMAAQTNLDSMYFSGKALAKFAGIVYTLHELIDDKAIAQAGLSTLKSAFSTFVNNQQRFPLVYETAWKGVVSTASYVTGDSGVDFGNTYYNDHHFHYGYFIYTAAVIASLDPTWLTPSNKDWVNTLVRDIANPSTQDNLFPVYRSFDWYHGHSWAHGLYVSYDGKDQESSSEDAMSAYALKLWGLASGDANMEARGNLQLAITARALQSYYLYESDNTIQPSNFIANKVAGILFENKVDHTTYFGTNIEYIQGIHMLPLLPVSTLTRTIRFVQEEWETYFDNGRADAVQGGWKGILYANLAIWNPQASWQFFSQPGFDMGWIDGGASRTWYLAMAAGLGGSP